MPLSETSGRFYFQRVDGSEMEGHPLHGVPFGGTGAYTPSSDRREGLKIYDGHYVRREIFPSMIWAARSDHPHETRPDGHGGQILTCKPIRAADLGEARVLVKLWFPGGVIERFWLEG
mgnify:CR=1 FL=1